MRLVNPDDLQGKHGLGRAIRLSCWLAPPGAATCQSGTSHALMRRLADSPQRQGKLRDAKYHVNHVAEPKTHAKVLIDGELATYVWTATYLHVLQGENPVLGLAAVYRAAAATGEALGERHRGVLDAACRRTPPRIPARAERHAISGSPRVCVGRRP